MKFRRWIPLALILLAFVVLHGYAGAVMWTLSDGHEMVAVIDRCDDERFSSTCEGTWTDVDGNVQSGEIAGSGASDAEAGEVAVRVGPLGAYKDSSSVLWIRLLPAALLDVGLLIAVVLLPVTLRAGRRAARMLRDEAAVGSRILAFTQDGTEDDGGPVYVILRRSDATTEVHTPQGVPLLYLRGSDKPRTIHVTRPDGRPVGQVVRLPQPDTMTALPPTYHLIDAHGALIGTGEMTVTLRTGSPTVFVDASQHPLATMVGHVKKLLRLEPGADGTAQDLLTAFTVGYEWFLSAGADQRLGRFQTGSANLALTSEGSGFVTGVPSITTVGTVSLPPLTSRTKLAASGSRQMLTHLARFRSGPSPVFNREQYWHPGRQYTTTTRSSAARA